MFMMIHRIGHVTLLSKEEECDVEWKMDFFTISMEDDTCYWSPDFTFRGKSCFLTIWPNGRKFYKSDGFISLFISSEGHNHPTNMEVTFSLKTANGQKDSETRKTFFCPVLASGGQGVERYLHRSVFEERKSEFWPSGSLTVVCTLKKMPSASDCATTGNKRSLDIDTVSSGKKKCTSKYVKCPECFTLIDLQNSRMESEKESLSQDFKKVLLNGTSHDVTLRTEDKELRAHRDILKARSRVFECMLNCDMKEKNSGIIDLPDCDSDTVEQLLLYIYSGRVEKLDQSNMIPLYCIADKYEVMDLKEMCCQVIKEHFTPSNLFKIIQLSVDHSDSDLQDAATEYFIRNMSDVLRTMEWKSFMKDNFTLANELLIESCERQK